jgi:uncharacterized protein (DUF1810 family)
MLVMVNHSNQQAEADPFDLNRFVEAQESVYGQALTELRRVRKESHWMWFMFPQLDGLGSSSTAKFYAIKSLEEAKAYLDHQLLGPRLLECCNVLLKCKEKSASEIFGFPDDLKLRSSMTLFAQVSQSDSVFARLLGRYFGGQLDQRTLELLKRASSG